MITLRKAIEELSRKNYFLRSFTFLHRYRNNQKPFLEKTSAIIANFLSSKMAHST